VAGLVTNNEGTPNAPSATAADVLARNMVAAFADVVGL
jgi:hypothetical protein